MKALPLLILGLAAAAAGAPADVAFDSLLTNDQLWSLDQDAFQKAAPTLPFRWTSAARDSARAASYSGMTLYGLKIYEFVARFEQKKLAVITVSFYARGDAGELSETAYEKLRQETVDTLTQKIGSKPTIRGKDATNAVRAEGLLWTTPKSQYLLEYSAIKEVKTRGIPFRAEFVRLEVRPPEQKQSLMVQALSARGVKFNPLAHVKRDLASGDVLLTDVPMVDQGRKGYCVVASTERVMRYYGNDVDSNELAQVANADAAGGTSVRAMRDSMKKLATRLKVRVRDQETMEVKDLESMVKEYNRVAKRTGEAELPDLNRIADLGDLFYHMKGPVLKEARTKNKAALVRFQHEVQNRIDAGIPLLWSVQLGLVPEPGLPQMGGGHMRLIVGYNAKTEEILYSDSWGAGHELKRMKADDAWTITTGLMTVEPLT